VNPRISPRSPSRATSFQRFRENSLELNDGERAFWDWMTIGGAGEGVRAHDLLTVEEKRTLSKSTSGGGFLAPSDIAEQIIAAARSVGALAQVALELVTADGGTLGVPTVATHGAPAWTGENVSYGAGTDEVVTQASLGAHKGTALQIISEELRQDAIATFDSYLAFELGQKLGGLQENAFCVGNGTGKPLGITDAGSGYTVSTAPTGSSLLFKPSDVLQFYKALSKEWRSQASWVIASDDFASLAASADTAGGLVFPSLQFDPPSLYGRPVLISGDMPAPAVSAISLAFGAWKSAYCIRRVDGVVLQRLDEKFSDSGQVGYKAFARVDGRPLLTAAAILGKHSAT
jgi:HK97 family phage major capsid protein